MHLLQKQKEKINGKKIIYHGRMEEGLKTITPHKCKHDKAYVYASENKALCVIFAVKRKGENIDFGVSKLGKVYIREFYEGAFEDRFAFRPLYLYKLNKKDFKRETEYIELVSDKKVEVVDCEFIPDAAEYLLKLEKENKLKILRYALMSSKQRSEMNELLIKALRKYSNFVQLSTEEIEKLDEEKKLNYLIQEERWSFCKKKFPRLMERIKKV